MKKRGRPPKIPAADVPDWSLRIRESREALGMSQEALGNAINGSQSSVGDYEAGKSEPSLAVFDAIAKALGTSPVWLVYGKPDDGDTVGIPTKVGKDDRLFAWTFHQAARLLAEEGLEGDLPYLASYTRKLLGSTKGATDDAEAKERIRATIEIERAEIRRGLDQIRKNRI